MVKRALFKLGNGGGGSFAQSSTQSFAQSFAQSSTQSFTQSFAGEFAWSLQLGEENALPSLEVAGKLRADEGLGDRFATWERAYRQLGSASRPVGIPKSATNTAPTARTVCTEAAIALEQRFNQWLRQPGALLLRETLLEQVRQDEELQLILQTDQLLLQRLPWHQWDILERFSQAELALSRPIYRRSPSKRPPPQSNVKVLAILGDSQGIDVERDRQLFKQLPDAEVTFLVEPRRAELSEQLWQQPWHILFFAGHSRTRRPDSSPSCAAGSAVANTETIREDPGEFAINPQETLTLTQLRYALKKAVSQGLQLAIFNSCDGLGLAQSFSDLDIPQLIVMREPVPDQVAQVFLQHFLQAYVGGLSLYSAVREARQRLQGLESEFPCATWLPVIFQNPAVGPPSWEQLKRDRLPQQNLQKPAPQLAPQLDPTSAPRLDPTSAPQPAQTSVQRPAPKPAQEPARLGQRFKQALRQSPQALGISAAIALGLLGVRHFGILQPLELKAYDQFLQLRPDEPPDDRILIIQVTEADVQAQQNQQPRGSLSDTSLLQLLQQLQPHQPAAIGLDIYRDFPAQLPVLAQELERSDRLFSVCRVGSGEAEAATRTETQIAPAPEAPGDRIGFSDNVLDDDGITRRHLLVMQPPVDAPCATPYALSTLLALQYLADRGIAWRSGAGDQVFLGDVLIPLIRSHSGSYQRVDPWGFQTLLNYRAYKGLEQPFARLTLGQALAGAFSPEAVRDRIVLIGTTAPSFRDATPTPYRSSEVLQTSGVFIQAQMVSQLISAALEGRPLLRVLPRWGEVLWIVGWSGLGGGVLLAVGLGWGLGLGLAGAALLHGALTLALLIALGLWTPILPALLGFGLSGFASVKILRSDSPAENI